MTVLIKIQISIKIYKFCSFSLPQVEQLSTQLWVGQARLVINSSPTWLRKTGRAGENPAPTGYSEC